jgi:hypothetical protein
VEVEKLNNKDVPTLAALVPRSGLHSNLCLKKRDEKEARVPMQSPQLYDRVVPRCLRSDQLFTLA